MSPKTQPDPSNPPQDVIDLLNAVDKGYVGLTKPKVEHHKEEPLSYATEHQARLAEGDYLPIDEQGYE